MYFAAGALESRWAQDEPRGDHRQRYAYSAHEDVTDAQGNVWRRKQDVTTVLLMGVDTESGSAVMDMRSGGQADFLQLIVVDRKEERVTQLQIDRDTMTPITILGVLGEPSGVRTAQICLSHGFGDGGAQSCELTKHAVENLLPGVEIDFYAALHVDGISVLNDWAGGVTVTLEEDLSALDPAMTAGATLTLTGDQAEIFVRSRREIGTGTNAARMQRQRAYIEGLSALLREGLGESEAQIGALYDSIAPYLTTDMPRGRAINELWAAREYDVTTIALEGEHLVGSDGFVEFWPEEGAAESAALELLYTMR
ncbi:MAG: LCP family protein [Eubacteriales bacterium]|nr:LCP family protein [Eubacteriales bacterium]